MHLKPKEERQNLGEGIVACSAEQLAVCLYYTTMPSAAAALKHQLDISSLLFYIHFKLKQAPCLDDKETEVHS